MRQFALVIPLLLFGRLFNAQENRAFHAGQYTILYTGRTLGYARSPDSQADPDPDAQGRKITAPDTGPNPVALEYRDLFSKLSRDIEGPVLRLGMGDNFSPNLFARTFYEGAGKFRWPKDRELADDQDNVARFFVDAGYQALVPGKHDFYFGALHLVDLARILATHNVRMLGANLIVTTQVANANPSVPERLSAHPYLANFGAVSIDLPDVVLPYTRQFSVKNARQVRPKSGKDLLRSDQLDAYSFGEVDYKYQLSEPQICWEIDKTTHADPDDVPLPSENKGNCAKLKVVEEACRVAADRNPFCESLLPPKGDPESADVSADATYVFEDWKAHLRAGFNHLFCAKVTDRGSDKNPWTCTPFYASVPLFDYDGETGARPPIAEPYTLARSGTASVAVFGVVDQDLLANIGELNSTWLNKDRRLDTAVQVASAEYSLRQAMDACNSLEICQSARKILMAQMSYAKAAQLIARMGETFDLVISQADPGHYTPTRSLEDSGPSNTFLPHFLVTPPAPYDFAKPAHDRTTPQERPFTPIVSRAIVTFKVPDKPAAGLTSTWKLNHMFQEGQPHFSDSACAAQPCITLHDLSVKALKKAEMDPRDGLTSQTRIVPPPASGVAPAPSEPLRDLALVAMRRRQHTDLAILQKRDMFDADHLSSQPIAQADVQDQINRIFWKGDFLLTINITGAQLKSMLAQSKKFDKLDDDALTTEVEKGRAMRILGVFSDPKDPDTYYINGAKLDEGALYTAATTNFLGLGDTGYTDLANPAVPPPLRLKDRDFHVLHSVGGVICHEIKGLLSPASCDDEPVVDEVNKYEYLDRSTQKPSDGSSGFDTISHYKTFFKRFLEPPVPTGPKVEGKVQQRAFWSLNLESADFNYSATLLRDFSTLANKFAGVSAPGVTTTGTKAYSEDYRLRLTYDYQAGTFYALTDSTFERTFTTGTVITSTPDNQWGVEVGGTLRMPWLKRPSWPSIQYAGRFDGQLFQPDTSSITFVNHPELAPLLLVPPKTSTVYGRLGLRASFDDAYVEGGIEDIDSRHVLAENVFSNSLYCRPTATDQFDCASSRNGNFNLPIDTLTQLSGLTLRPTNTADYLTGGVYLNFRIRFPLWSRFSPTGADQGWYFVVTNRGDFYFNSASDTNLQTRYLDKLTPSLNFPILGNFVLSPKVDVVFYENKVNHSHYRALEPLVSLSYSFKWREGLNFYRALRYGAITLPPTPSQ